MNEVPLWLVTGDKLGDNAQLLVIAEALGLPYEVRRVIPRKEYIYGKPPFEPSLYHLDMEKSDPLVPPWAAPTNTCSKTVWPQPSGSRL